jgi:hypothetical protein
MQLQADNKRLADQLAILHSPVMLDQRARELNLGLAPAQPAQVVRLAEAAPAEKSPPRQFAQRTADDLTP